MSHWFTENIIDNGRLPLFMAYIGFILGFLGIRISVRLIRAEVSWWFNNVTPGGLHIHHVVFGTVLTMLSGLGLIALAINGSQTTLSIFAALFGVGAALVLDEFALIFYLRDVYWAEEGRASLDAVFVAMAVTGLILLGYHPLDWWGADTNDVAATIAAVIYSGVVLALAGLVLLKGKIWTGLIGLFIFPLLVVAAIRLARPTSPWARWRYTKRPKKMNAAVRRERRVRRPLIRAKIFLQDLMAGKPDVAHAKSGAEEELNAKVHPAPAKGESAGLVLTEAISPGGGASGTIDQLPFDGQQPGTPAVAETSRRPHESEHEPVEP
ncbi:hypothetical protein [Williamsia sp. 1135]|uniref:hypothetical protein n=1 Tax=Williamsia sp. 1135 TaxID=1889262 RepID=UPI000A1178DA|nr:hypothetical protein [Williamsia sp. 1135]ORM37411.1 hypothetical protein BFL43_04445 [Williamsia sp. 1135]